MNSRSILSGSAKAPSAIKASAPPVLDRLEGIRLRALDIEELIRRFNTRLQGGPTTTNPPPTPEPGNTIAEAHGIDDQLDLIESIQAISFEFLSAIGARF